MAKKRRVRTTPSVPPQTVGSSARGVPWPPATPVASSRRPTSGLANYDYTYVRRDLRRIGVLAVLLLSGQIVLAFLLPHLLR